jgi:hypothetical protein
MSIRVPTSITVGLLTCGLVAFAPSTASARTALPDTTTYMTLTGCFVHEIVVEKGKEKAEYVLAHPVIGTVPSVPVAHCWSSPHDQAIELDGVSHHLDASLLGRYIEVTGKLEGFENEYELREMNVKGYREVPVVPPHAHVAPPHPSIAPVEPAPQQTRQLPPTASSLPLAGLIGVLAFTGALALRLFRHRRTAECERGHGEVHS